jgi:hypothetical protein
MSRQRRFHRHPGLHGPVCPLPSYRNRLPQTVIWHFPREFL